MAWDLAALAPSTRAALLLAGLVLAAALASAAPGEPGTRIAKVAMPGPWSPARDVPADAHARNAQCESCHQEIAQQWRSSLHKSAYTNAEFQRALAVEPLPFCRGCHAPEADPTRATMTKLHEQGVSCISCHLSEGQVLAVAGSAGNGSPHALTRLAEFATERACANCHEFEFPGEVRTAMPNLMQSTVSEHQQSAFAARSCADCHMPATTTGHRDHTFSASRNEAALRDAVAVSVSRPSPSQLEFQLTTNGVGHAFPTGDLFRRVTLEADALGPEFSSLASASVYLTREFATEFSAATGARRRLIRDTRLLPSEAGGKRVTLDLGAAAANATVAWRVLYQRVDHPGKIGQADAHVAGEVELAVGQLPRLGAAEHGFRSAKAEEK